MFLSKSIGCCSAEVKQHGVGAKSPSYFIITV